MTEKQIDRERRHLLEQIRNHMAQNNITQAEAAAKCFNDNGEPWHQQTVQRMLNGDFGPKLDNLIQLCNAIGMRIALKSTVYPMGEE